MGGILPRSARALTQLFEACRGDEHDRQTEQHRRARHPLPRVAHAGKHEQNERDRRPKDGKVWKDPTSEESDQILGCGCGVGDRACSFEPERHRGCARCAPYLHQPLEVNTAANRLLTSVSRKESLALEGCIEALDVIW